MKVIVNLPTELVERVKKESPSGYNISINGLFVDFITLGFSVRKLVRNNPGSKLLIEKRNGKLFQLVME